MITIPRRLKRTALFAVVTLGTVGGLMSAASAHYFTQRCDRDGDDCVTLRCDDDGDDCRPVAHRHYTAPSYYGGYNGYHGSYDGGYAPGVFLGLSLGSGYNNEEHEEHEEHEHGDDD